MSSPASWAALHDAIAGEVVRPDLPAYNVVRKPALGGFDHVRPEAVVRCRTAADVAETISFARRCTLPLAVRSGGHCFAGRSSTPGVVIDVRPMASVELAGEVATVGAGARLAEVYDALAERAVTIPAGCGPSVGIAGLTLGGGIGILGRAHGLTCDHLLGAQVVLADGRLVACDEHRHEDLFWAHRGAGGGTFGVVTSLEFRTLPAPEATSFDLVWPATCAAAVIAAWQAWAPFAAEELAASLLVTADGDVDRPPLVHVFGAMLAGPAETTRLLGELVARAGVDPTSADHRHAPYRETKRYLDELFRPADGGEHNDQRELLFSKSEFFRRPLPPHAIAALVEHLATGRVPGQARELDFTPWGGAYNRVPADATAFVHRRERFLLHQTVVIGGGGSGDERGVARRWLARSWALAHPWGSGRVYPNFPDPDLADWANAYHGPNYDRLVRIKRVYDPYDVFRFPQSVGSVDAGRRD